MGFFVLVKCHLYIELDLRSWLQREWVHLDPMWKNQVLFISWTCWTKWPPILQTARNLPFHLKLILFLFPQYVVSIKPKCNFFSKKILLTMSSTKMLVILSGLQYLFCWKGAARLLIACCALIKRFDVIEWTCVYIYIWNKLFYCSLQSIWWQVWMMTLLQRKICVFVVILLFHCKDQHVLCRSPLKMMKWTLMVNIIDLFMKIK